MPTRREKRAMTQIVFVKTKDRSVWRKCKCKRFNRAFAVPTTARRLVPKRLPPENNVLDASWRDLESGGNGNATKVNQGERTSEAPCRVQVLLPM